MRAPLILRARDPNLSMLRADEPTWRLVPFGPDKPNTRPDSRATNGSLGGAIDRAHAATDTDALSGHFARRRTIV